MRGSVKANLIVFFIIAITAFCISSAFAALTIHEDTDSYKMIHIENDSFEPEEVHYVETYIPKNDTNTTNNTITNITDSIEDTISDWTDSGDDLIVTYED